MSVRYATEHRCGVVVSGPGLSDCISGTDPLRDNLPLLVRSSASHQGKGRLIVGKTSNQRGKIQSAEEGNSAAELISVTGVLRALLSS